MVNDVFKMLESLPKEHFNVIIDDVTDLDSELTDPQGRHDKLQVYGLGGRRRQ